jgi:hypothetical protein
MNGYNLTDKQKELLRKLVRYIRERKLTEPIAPVSTDQGYFIWFRGGGSLEHQGDLVGDLDALCDAGLMKVRWEKGKRLYNVKQAGYDAVDNNFGAPLIPESPVIAQPRKEQSGTLPMAQIFLCYAEEDEEKVGNLYQKLSDAGFKPWMAKKDLVGGEIWQLSIQQAIRRSDFVVVCLSAISVNKRSFVQREIKDALDIWREKLESDIYLIPVRLEDCEVPESLRNFHWVNLFEEGGWTRLVEAIQEGMKRRAETLVESITPSRTSPATRRSVARIGDTIPEVGLAKEDLSMTLIGWAESDIAVSGPYAGGGFYTFTARPRMKFIILEFEFHNNWVRGQKTPHFNKGEVRTDKGYFYQVWSPPGGIHSEEYAPRPSTQKEVENLGGSGAFEDLLPEESVRGHVVFEIPEDGEPEEVELSQVPVPIKLD